MPFASPKRFTGVSTCAATLIKATNDKIFIALRENNNEYEVIKLDRDSLIMQNKNETYRLHRLDSNRMNLPTYRRYRDLLSGTWLYEGDGKNRKSLIICNSEFYIVWSPEIAAFHSSLSGRLINFGEDFYLLLNGYGGSEVNKPEKLDSEYLMIRIENHMIKYRHIKDEILPEED